eukprot:GILI01022197.1.p1 GENE.GILI01022197.1~~GILI01022197.1.p1  ORF type:complete len:232 (+),score=30.27 GILI01022197.1:37-696(+)
MENSAPPQSFLVVHDVAKRSNWGSLIRSAVAFGVRTILLVGGRQDKIKTFGSHGTVNHVTFKWFPSLEALKEWLKARNISLCGVEICEQAKPVTDHPFTGPTAFLPGNEGYGLTDKQMELCDQFVYIPQYSDGTASLNVTVATSIIMHHFAVWGKYSEYERSGYKFVVHDVDKRVAFENRSDEQKEEDELIQKEREARRQYDWANSEGAEEGGLGSMFE